LNNFKISPFRSIYPVIFLLLSAWLTSCSGSEKRTTASTDQQSVEDSVVRFNHQIVKSESQEISDFILRYHWEMNETQTGLRYLVYKKGEGNRVEQGDVVAIKYKINLLNGDMVFRSDSISLVHIEVGARTVVSGLEEGLMLMKKGDRAKLIVPSHLAYGVLGDMAKIPARAVLVYDVEVCAIKRSKK